MKLFVDLQGAQTPGSRNRGIGRYSRELLRAILQAEGSLNEIYLGWNHLFASPVDDLNLQSKSNDIAVVSAPYGALGRQKYGFQRYDATSEINHAILANCLARSKCEHVLFTSLMEGADENFVLPRNLNFSPFVSSYSIVYDVIPLLFPSQYLSSDALRAHYMAYFNVKISADLIFTISDRTRRDLLNLTGLDPDKVINIGTGIRAEDFGSVLSPGISPIELGVTKPFIMFLGGDEFRKNLSGFTEAVVHALLHFSLDMQAIIVGAVEQETIQRTRQSLEQAGLPADTFVFTGHLSNDALKAAYGMSSLVVLPSLYEGFGLPVLEAMACNASIVASLGTSMADIYDHEDLLFDPYNTADIANKIKYAMTNPKRLEGIKKTYQVTLEAHTWKRVAERALAAMHNQQERMVGSALNAPMSKKAELRLAFAFAGPIAEELHPLLESLSRTHSVVLYTDDASTATTALPIPLDRLQNVWKHFDEGSPVYCFGENIDELSHLSKVVPGCNAIFISNVGFGVEVANSTLSDAVGSAYAIWQRDGLTVNEVKSILRPVNAKHCLSRQESLEDAIVINAVMFLDASPIGLASELKTIVSRAELGGEMFEAIAQAAGVAQLETSVVA